MSLLRGEVALILKRAVPPSLSITVSTIAAGISADIADADGEAAARVSVVVVVTIAAEGSATKELAKVAVAIAAEGVASRVYSAWTPGARWALSGSHGEADGMHVIVSEAVSLSWGLLASVEGHPCAPRVPPPRSLRCQRRSGAHVGIVGERCFFGLW